VLTARHWVKFTVMHVHVKPTAQRSSLLGKMMSSSVEVADRTSLEVGVGFLPLMLNGESIIEDAEHQVSLGRWFLKCFFHSQFAPLVI